MPLTSPGNAFEFVRCDEQGRIKWDFKHDINKENERGKPVETNIAALIASFTLQVLEFLITYLNCWLLLNVGV